MLAWSYLPIAISDTSVYSASLPVLWDGREYVDQSDTVYNA